ncbi:MAG: OB-fold nucleic acid binding domain-containing protein [bacterium]|nr:OB-fold nucleic acid binding domain-containing protein [bacterium]
MNDLSQPTAQGTVCPSCHRFVGAYDRCPFCGTGIPKRIPLRVVRSLSLLVAIAGLVCLHLMAMYRDVPTVSIGAISPAMNFGYKRVIARVSQPLRYYRDGDKITGCSFLLEDDTGELRVRAFRPVAEALYHRGFTLRKGDRVSVTGTLQVLEDTPRMLLQSPDQLEILEPAEVLDLALSELGGTPESRPVRVKAAVEQIVPPRSERAPYRIVLRDGTGTANLVVWPPQFSEIPEEHRPLPGSIVEVRATVSTYRGAPQLQLDDPRDFVRLALASASDVSEVGTAPPLTPLADITSADIGRTLQISATITDVRTPAPGSRAPYMVTLQDGSARHTLVFWKDTYDKLANPSALVPGSRVNAQVQVGEFRGRVQLQLRDASKLSLTPEVGTPPAAQPPNPAQDSASRPQQASPAPPASLDAGALTTASLGQRLTIQGRVVSFAAPTSPRSPYRLTLRGEMGDATVVIWAPTWQQIPPSQQPTTGMLLRVSGEVAEFKQQKELRVRHAADLQEVR